MQDGMVIPEEVDFIDRKRLCSNLLHNAFDNLIIASCLFADNFNFSWFKKIVDMAQNIPPQVVQIGKEYLPILAKKSVDFAKSGYRPKLGSQNFNNNLTMSNNRSSWEPDVVEKSRRGPGFQSVVKVYPSFSMPTRDVYQSDVSEDYSCDSEDYDCYDSEFDDTDDDLSNSVSLMSLNPTQKKKRNLRNSKRRKLLRLKLRILLPKAMELLPEAEFDRLEEYWNKFEDDNPNMDPRKLKYKMQLAIWRYLVNTWFKENPDEEFDATGSTEPEIQEFFKGVSPGLGSLAGKGGSGSSASSGSSSSATATANQNRPLMGGLLGALGAEVASKAPTVVRSVKNNMAEFMNQKRGAGSRNAAARKNPDRPGQGLPKSKTRSAASTKPMSSSTRAKTSSNVKSKVRIVTKSKPVAKVARVVRVASKAAPIAGAPARVAGRVARRQARRANRNN